MEGYGTLKRGSVFVSVRACDRADVQMPLLGSARLNSLGGDAEDIRAKGEYT